jgi:FHA domain
MARLKCTACGGPAGRADPVCRTCGTSLLEDGAVTEVPEQSRPPEGDGATRELPQQVRPLVSQPSARPPSSEAGERALEQCPHCGADIPDPRNLVCTECMTELSPGTVEAGAWPTAPVGNDHNRYATVYEAGGTRLVVRFAFGHVELSVGQEVLIGRDATDEQLASLDDMRNVSRRHATIGLAPHGGWVRDEGSTNGTYVNGRTVKAGESADLPEGAELRLASNVRATVALRRPGGVQHG